MQDAKTGGSRWVPDIREDEITEFQEQNGDETATYKAVNVHPIISRVLDKLAFFRTHVSAVWYNKLANKTVKDKLDEIDTSISSLNSNLESNVIYDDFLFSEVQCTAGTIGTRGAQYIKNKSETAKTGYKIISTTIASVDNSAEINPVAILYNEQLYLNVYRAVSTNTSIQNVIVRLAYVKL